MHVHASHVCGAGKAHAELILHGICRHIRLYYEIDTNTDCIQSALVSIPLQTAWSLPGDTCKPLQPPLSRRVRNPASGFSNASPSRSCCSSTSLLTSAGLDSEPCSSFGRADCLVLLAHARDRLKHKACKALQHDTWLHVCTSIDRRGCLACLQYMRLPCKAKCCCVHLHSVPMTGISSVR